MAADKTQFALSKATLVAIEQYKREHGLKRREDVIELAIALLLESQRESDADIAISTISLPVNVAPKFVPIKKGENEAAVEFGVPATVAVGPTVFVIQGTAKVNNKDVVAVAIPVFVTVNEPKK